MFFDDSNPPADSFHVAEQLRFSPRKRRSERDKTDAVNERPFERSACSTPTGGDPRRIEVLSQMEAGVLE